MKSALVNLLVTRALPLLVPFIVYPLMQLLKRFWPWLDRQSELVKNPLVVVLGLIVAGVAAFVGVALPAECVDVGQGLTALCWNAITGSPTFLSGIVGALLAIGWKKTLQANR